MAKATKYELPENAEVTDYKIDVTHGKAKVTIDYNSKSKTFSILNPIGTTEFGFKRPIKQLGKQDQISLWKDVAAALTESVEIVDTLISKVNVTAKL